ncbi:hypothetical protein C5Y96_12330 [Blastopirellula marina]|uniref:Uncharacterized protein n=1 Tax=Blastopirellula marina TaxID=124 RepID=A0A2S8FGU0_9BACT|nr:MULTISPECIES: hypothetical protein [Pirellulaceae]PQO31134.1 hypothetical protein C5Y96_12330 [Blastopirellula marina]RCS51528.1 hypothetical protein DTL36_12340 [Bremerella cremea]
MDAQNPYCSPQVDSPGEVYLHRDIFRGTTLAWFVDRYEFFVPEIEAVVPQAISFYETIGAKLIAREPLTFWRGNWWSTLLGPEHRARQRIVVSTDASEHRVSLEYHINMILPTRLYYNSQREALRLAADLGAVHPDTLRRG